MCAMASHWVDEANKVAAYSKRLNATGRIAKLIFKPKVLKKNTADLPRCFTLDFF